MDQIKHQARALTTPTIDFLLLGGASLYVWVIMVGLRLLNPSFTELSFYYLSVTFLWLNLICNFPHFIVSYRFGYGRGKDFIKKNPGALILVPILMIIFYCTSFIFFDSQIKTSPMISGVNSLLESMGASFQFGQLPNLGLEIISLSVRLMFITAAWHYSKQAFGCIMVFSHYARYPLSVFQRRLWKASLYSVSFYNLLYVSNLTFSTDGPFSNFLSAPVTNSQFPEELLGLAFLLVILLALAVCFFIIYKNYKEKSQLPTSSIVIPWIALHIWWIPFLGHHDFYFLAVPFFHSLQYLLFAYQLEAPDSNLHARKKMLTIGLKYLCLCVLGFVFFSALPKFLDRTLTETAGVRVLFFFIAIPTFINIHHFFIDSVVWRFSDEHVRAKLLD